ncbi:collagen alpha-1(XIV) chain-like [Myiozetetes cayanensis]|uniref:collagen alpha-1(XIV) chain-like n=1 Tax=Myiozetetes cayanensis TaxID=478635 RepID=UPI00215E952A|nr:collagen alpha-1(XIV) chain-like [Myiozetetes cayanensis]
MQRTAWLDDTNDGPPAGASPRALVPGGPGAGRHGLGPLQAAAVLSAGHKVVAPGQGSAAENPRSLREFPSESGILSTSSHLPGKPRAPARKQPGSGGAGAAGSTGAPEIEAHRSRPQERAERRGTRRPPSGGLAGVGYERRALQADSPGQPGPGVFSAHGQPAVPAPGNPLQLLLVPMWSHLHAPIALDRVREAEGADQCLQLQQVPALGGAPHKGRHSGLGPWEARGQRCLPWKSPLPLSLWPTKL